MIFSKKCCPNATRRRQAACCAFSDVSMYLCSSPTSPLGSKADLKLRIFGVRSSLNSEHLPGRRLRQLCAVGRYFVVTRSGDEYHDLRTRALLLSLTDPPCSRTSPRDGQASCRRLLLSTGDVAVVYPL